MKRNHLRRGRTACVLWASTLLGFVALTAGCGGERAGTPYTRAVDVNDPQVALGRQVFAAHCYQCHPGGAGGVAPAINDKPLPEQLIKTQVRAGLGAMPGFDKDRINDEQLDAVVRYLKELRAVRKVASR
jgi:mono/diheme cytochrome c family protein